MWRERASAAAEPPAQNPRVTPLGGMATPRPAGNLRFGRNSNRVTAHDRKCRDSYARPYFGGDDPTFIDLL